MPENYQYDRNMWHILMELITFVVVDGSAYVSVYISHGMNSAKTCKINEKIKNIKN
jgi:hypothetical protein